MSTSFDIGHIIESVLTAAFFGGVFLATIKADTKGLKDQVKAMGAEVMELKKVLITLADHRGRMDVIDERMMAQGRRFDEFSTRFNRLIDQAAESRTP